VTIIKLKNLKVGMVLARDAEDLNGRVLLKSGAKITEKNLKILKSWGVTEFDVQKATKEDIENIACKDLSPELLEKAEAEVTRFFSHTDSSHPAVKELFDLCVIRKAKSISGKKA
tara:strand:- start:1953 stop:2297 length:345 start_codon:yes stop_codon:yes gene_type:complete